MIVKDAGHKLGPALWPGGGLLVVLCTLASANDKQPARVKLEANQKADVEVALSSPQELPEIWDRFNDPNGAYRDVVVDGNTMFIATGLGVLECALTADAMTFTAKYGKSSGLPSDNVVSVRRDTRGGLWCMSDRGIGYRCRGGGVGIVYSG